MTNYFPKKRYAAPDKHTVRRKSSQRSEKDIHRDEEKRYVFVNAKLAIDHRAPEEHRRYGEQSFPDAVCTRSTDPLAKRKQKFPAVKSFCGKCVHRAQSDIDLCKLGITAKLRHRRKKKSRRAPGRDHAQLFPV